MNVLPFDQQVAVITALTEGKRRVDLVRRLSVAFDIAFVKKGVGAARGGLHAQGQSQRHHGELRAAGNRRAARPHSLSRGRQRVLRVPGRRLRQAFHLHLARPARSGRDRQAGRDLFDRIVRRRRRRLHGCDRRRAGARERRVAGRGDRAVARQQISRARQDALGALLLAEDATHF